jgi:deoxyribodipyrimidine photolyase-like uncharacterized protein
LAAMRHFRVALEKRGITVHYRQLDDAPHAGILKAEFATGRPPTS